MNSASALASSVLPTPVGPRKRNVPIGRFGSARPARERRSAFETASTASSWPITRSCRRSSMWISFSTSPSIRRETGIPVHLATTSATSCSVTSSVSIEPPAACSSRELRLLLGQRRLELGDLAVPELPGLGEVGVALGAVGLALGLVEFGFATLIASIAPFSFCQRAFISPGALAQLGELGLDRGEALLRGLVLLLLQRLALDLELLDAPVDLVDLGRDRLDLHLQPRGGLVDQVDRLVGEEAVGDVALGEGRGGDDRGVGDADAVVAPRSAP